MKQVASGSTEGAFKGLRDAGDEWKRGVGTEFGVVLWRFLMEWKLGKEIVLLWLLRLLLLRLLLMLLLLALLLLLGLLLGCVRSRNLFEFFPVVTVVFVDIEGEFNFAIHLFRCRAQTSGTADFTFEGRRMDGWVVVGVRLDEDVGVGGFAVDFG